MTTDRLVPEIFVHDGPAALEFYKRAFGAKELSRMMAEDGRRVLHAQLEINGHRMFLCDEFKPSEGGTCRSPRSLDGTCIRLMLEVDDARRVFKKAVKAGAKVMFPLEDMFWGARYGKVVDPFGHEWGINQTLSKPSPQKERAEAKKYFAKKKS
jgi:PhnB protein